MRALDASARARLFGRIETRGTRLSVKTASLGAQRVAAGTGKGPPQPQLMQKACVFGISGSIAIMSQLTMRLISASNQEICCGVGNGGGTGFGGGPAPP